MSDRPRDRRRLGAAARGQSSRDQVGLALLAGALFGLACDGTPREPIATAPTGSAASRKAPNDREPPVFLEPPVRRGDPQYLPAIELRIGGHPMRAEVARTDAERAKGLMFRTDLGPDEGMLFCFPSEQIRSFYMRNTPLPLSIAYIDARGEIVDILDMTPYDESEVLSSGPALFALEAHQSWFRRKGISVGARVDGLAEVFRRPELTPR